MNRVTGQWGCTATNPSVGSIISNLTTSDLWDGAAVTGKSLMDR